MLSDPEKRQRYDQYGHAGVDPNFGAGGFGGGAGFEDFDLATSSPPSLAVDLAGAPASAIPTPHSEIARCAPAWC